MRKRLGSSRFCFGQECREALEGKGATLSTSVARREPRQPKKPPRQMVFLKTALRKNDCRNEHEEKRTPASVLADSASASSRSMQ